MFLVLESVWFFYLFIPACILLFLFLTEYDGGANVGFSTTLLLAVLILLQVFTYVKPFTFMLGNWITSASIMAGYFVAGALYVWVKWYSYYTTAIRLINEYREKYSHVTLNDAAYAVGYRNSVPFKVSDHKAMIFSWILYWPLSITWTLLNDPVRRFVNFIYNSIASSLQRMSDSAFEKLK
jgi:hypothetical protein